MKTIKRAAALAFLLELGFSKAADWDNERMEKNLAKVPDHVTKETVTASFVPLFNDIVEAKGAVKVVDDEPVKEEKAKEETTKKPAAKAKVKSAAKKPAVKAKAEKKSTKAEKKPTKAKKEKAPKAPKPAKEKDAFGFTVGTVRNKVAVKVGAAFHTVDELAEKAGTKARQTKLTLRRMVKAGFVEKRRRIEYRLVEKTKK